jgi:hypothetical protein
MPPKAHPKAYAIVEKESGKIIQVHMTRSLAWIVIKGTPGYRIIPVEIKKLKK